MLRGKAELEGKIPSTIAGERRGLWAGNKERRGNDGDDTLLNHGRHRWQSS